MKGTVILRYVGNRPEPEESAVPKGELEFPPPLPSEWEEFHQKFRQDIQRELEESFRIPVGKKEGHG